MIGFSICICLHFMCISATRMYINKAFSQCQFSKCHCFRREMLKCCSLYWGKPGNGSFESSGYCKSHFVFNQWLLIVNSLGTASIIGSGNLDTLLLSLLIMFWTSKPNGSHLYCVEVVAEVSAAWRDLKPCQFKPKFSVWLDTIGVKWENMWAVCFGRTHYRLQSLCTQFYWTTSCRD